MHFKTLRPGKHCSHCANDISKCIFQWVCQMWEHSIKCFLSYRAHAIYTAGGGFDMKTGISVDHSDNSIRVRYRGGEMNLLIWKRSEWLQNSLPFSHSLLYLASPIIVLFARLVVVMAIDSWKCSVPKPTIAPGFEPGLRAHSESRASAKTNSAKGQTR